MPDTLNTPDGERAEENELVTTDRTKQRDEEDERFVPVIVKRTDESRRHPDDMLEHAVKDGLEQIRRRGVSLTLSATAGGMILGFTAMPVAVVAKTVAEGPWAGFSRILMALAYPLGFVICILSGAQLFTEHTATAVYPVLDGKASARELLRLWLIVIVGNLLGAGIIATLLSLAEPVIAAHEGYEIVGRQSDLSGSLGARHAFQGEEKQHCQSPSKGSRNGRAIRQSNAIHERRQRQGCQNGERSERDER